jgi:DNA polymerase-1
VTDKLLLLDGHSLAYRAFYALPTDLATKAGTVTNAVYGFTSMLVKILADERPDFVAVAFDTGAPTFRLEMDPEYKATRKETPDLFRPQLGLIREVLDGLQIRVLELDGVEADDVIATLARQADAAGIDTVVVTGDRDAFQLVSDPHVKVLYNRRGVSDYVLYDVAGIEARTGVPPDQYPELAALRGDTSDNLPGVPGIGDKTAAKLLTTYGSLEAVFEHLEDLPPKQRQNLGEWQERVLTNREMIVLRTDCEVGVTPGDLRQGSWDREAVRTLFNQLEFRSLWDRLLEACGDEAVADEAGALDTDVEHVDAAGAAALFEAIRADGARYALEPVWSGRPGRSDLRGLGVATAEREAFVGAELLADALVRQALNAVVASPAPLVVHDAKDLLHGLGDVGFAGLDVDTEIAAWLVDPGAGGYGVDELAARHLGVSLEAAAQADEGTLDFEGRAEGDRAGRHAAAVLQLASVLREVLEARELDALYERFERPLIPVLARMEGVGVKVDLEFLEELSADLGKECDRLESRIHGHAREPFNVNSTPQLRVVLFEHLGLTPVKKTPKGEPSTDADSLQKLADQHPIIEDLLRYREVEKLRSTYADALPPLVGPDGRIHATFKQAATSTGRISSEAPNLQNVPVRTADGREIRRAFVADAGAVLLAADYSQIELRVLAHLASDPGLIDAFERDADIHTATAARVFGVAEADVTSEHRRFAKVVNYGLAYGMEAYGLAQRLGVETEEARGILDAYFEGFPNVASYMEGVVAEARTRGYTTTLFGRRRLLPELASDNFRIRQMGERMAQNAPVQGSAADIFKLAMIELDGELRERGMGTRMILTVHDELVFEVPTEEGDAATALVCDVMEGVTELAVPLKVDAHLGATWAECKG